MTDGGASGAWTMLTGLADCPSVKSGSAKEVAWGRIRKTASQ
jgi:hypothetical protein